MVTGDHKSIHEFRYQDDTMTPTLLNINCLGRYIFRNDL